MVKDNNFLKLHGLGEAVNGDDVVGFVSPNMKGIPEGYATKAKAHLFMSKEDKKSKTHELHLGLVNLMATSGIVKKTFGADIIKSNAVLDLDSRDTVVQYDIAIPSNDCDNFRVIKDSWEQGNGNPIGQDGAPFYVFFDKAPTTGDIFKYDVNSHYQTQVSQEIGSVEQVGENAYKVWMIFETNSGIADFPTEALREGVQWVKIGHPMGEMDLQWSTVSSGGVEPGYYSMEWALGSPHGVEVAWTMEAGNIQSVGAGQLADRTAIKFKQEMSKLSGGGENKSLFVSGRFSEGVLSITRISNLMEILCMAEAYRMESMANMFATAHTYTGSSGRPQFINDGLWTQARRGGKIITYARPMAISEGDLAEAASYHFKNSGIPVNERNITFVGGENAYANGMVLLQKHGMDLMNSTPAILTGNQGFLNNKNFVQGDLNALRIKAPAIKEAFIPGVGNVSFEHDPSFDNSTYSTGNTARDGFSGMGGLNKLSYSLMVKDNSTNTNIVNSMRGAKLVEDGNINSSIYYVKPKFAHLVWGDNLGRMNDGSQTAGVRSSLRHMGQEFWVSIQSGMLMMDTTTQVIIELDNTYTK